jgi:hypothetical protein
MPYADSQLLIIILFVVLALATGWIIRLEIRLNKLLKGSDGKSLESNILKLKKTEEEFGDFKGRVEIHLRSVDKKLSESIRHVDTLRFDPFKGGGAGGSQSFATAFLNEKGNGVVISTIHTRERVGVYSKPIKNGRSEYELTNEEKTVIESANK